MESRVIIHCDADNYFCAVEEKFNPALRRVPFAVCGDPQMRHSIVMSKNNLAKKAGVMTGISFRQAKQICPNLHYITADYRKYLSQTKLLRAVFDKYSDNVIHYGLDESWIELKEMSFREAEQIAELIRLEIYYSLELSASLGVSDNLIFSKLGSDLNKPNGITAISPDNYRETVWTLPVLSLLFVGEKRHKVLQNAGLYTIGDIAQSEPERLAKLLGKVGYDLCRYANGDDRNFKPNSDTIGSIGNTITPPADLRSNEDVSATLYLLASTVCARLKKHGLKAGSLSINMKDSAFNKTIRQSSFKATSDNEIFIFNQAWSLFKRHYKWERPLRSIGVVASKLDGNQQLSLFPLEHELDVDMDHRIQRLTERFGQLKVEESAFGWGAATKNS